MAFSGSVEDRLAIRELLDDYCDCVNRNDAAGWSLNWAEDATWALPDYPEYGTIVGREAIVAAWIRMMAEYPGIVFIATIGHIAVDGDRAEVRSYTSDVHTRNGITQRNRGRYDDVMIRGNGCWLLAHRTFRLLHSE